MLALQQAAAAPQDAHGAPQGSAYELMQAQLHEHLRTLKNIHSVEKKIEAKRAMLADFEPYLDGVLQANSGAQDVVLSTVLVWHIDVGNWARALQLARYALVHGLKLPDQYNRDLPTLLIDEYADAALAGKLTGEDALKHLSAVGELTQARDAPDQARAKLHKAVGWALLGKTAMADVDPKNLPPGTCQAALTHLLRAIELWPQVGVKKDVERLQRRLAGDKPAA